MSHWTEQKCIIDDLDVVAAAAKELGASVVMGGIARGWGSDTKKCDMVITPAEGRYDVAVTKNKDGVYEIEGDLYDNSIAKAFGDERNPYAKLLDLYGYIKVERQCQQRRIATQRIKNSAGKLQLRVCA